MKKFMALVLACVMLLSLTACGSKDSGDTVTPGSKDEVYNLRLATDVVPENYIVKYMNDAIAEVEEKTDGHVKIKMYAGGTLGSYTAVHSQLMTGDIDMAINYIDPNYDPRLNVFIFPGLYTDYSNFIETMAPGTYLWNLLNDIEGGFNLELLGAVNSGLMGLGTVKAVPSDFATCVDYDTKKDVLLRIPSMDLYLNLVTDMGYRTTTIAYSDLYPALQTGVADGWAGGTPVNNWDSFRDVIEYYVDAQYLCETLPVVINKDSIGRLPEEYQDVIREVFLNAANTASAESEVQANAAMDNMEGMGITVIKGTEEEHAAFIEEIRSITWPKLETLIGEDIFAELCEEFAVE